jgi:hypothetical protein
VARVAARTAAKVKALLARRGLCEDDAEPSAEEPDLSATLQAASLTERVALGPKAGWKIARAGAGGASPAAVRVPASASERLADKDGYNVHAGTYVPAHARDKLERLCRYILRTALARDRLSRMANGDVVWALKRPRADGTTHLVFEPLTFLERLAALVPPPRSHLVLYHGVLSSHAAWRAEVLPAAPTTTPAPSAPRPADGPASRPGVPTTATSETATDASAPASQDPALRARRLRWAELLRRVFGLEVRRCPRCGAERRIVAFITRPTQLRRLCAHLGYPTEVPPIAPARAPPQPDLWDQPTDAY